MTDYFIWILLVSMWCWGFHNAFEEGQIFGKFGDYLRDNIVDFWLKPLFTCPICMVSVHGTIWYFISQPEYSFTSWIMFIVAASGINYVIYNLFSPTE